MVATYKILLQTHEPSQTLCKHLFAQYFIINYSTKNSCPVRKADQLNTCTELNPAPCHIRTAARRP